MSCNRYRVSDSGCSRPGTPRGAPTGCPSGPTPSNNDDDGGGGGARVGATDGGSGTDSDDGDSTRLGASEGAGGDVRVGSFRSREGTSGRGANRARSCSIIETTLLDLDEQRNHRRL